MPLPIKECCGSKGPRHKTGCTGEAHPLVEVVPTEEQLQHIADAVSGKNVPTTEETLSITSRVGGDAVTKSGIIIPGEVLAKMSPTNFHFMVQYSGSEARVVKVAPSGRTLPVRVYDLTTHGENYKQLAEQFCKKNNK